MKRTILKALTIAMLIPVLAFVCAEAFFLQKYSFSIINCLKSKGQIMFAPLSSRLPYCVHSHSDGGKPCDYSDDCEGACIFDTVNGPSYCAPNDDLYGCRGVKSSRDGKNHGTGGKVWCAD